MSVEQCDGHGAADGAYLKWTTGLRRPGHRHRSSSEGDCGADVSVLQMIDGASIRFSASSMILQV